MSRRTLIISAHLLISLAVLVLWWVETRPGNYTWDGGENLSLNRALTIIFLIKTAFWLLVANMLVIAVAQWISGNKNVCLFAGIATAITYFLLVGIVDRKCATQYYAVFVHQSVAEEYIEQPVRDAGYPIGEILAAEVLDKQMSNRRYAISGLAEIQYSPAIPVLEQILNDRLEKDVFRMDAYDALKAFDMKETEQILRTFEKRSTDSSDKAIINRLK